jgi:hypothetical protein
MGIRESKVAKNLRLMDIVLWLNNNFGAKMSGKPFTAQDVEQYVRLEKLPDYLGNFKIVKATEFQTLSIKVYHIVETIEED